MANRWKPRPSTIRDQLIWRSRCSSSVNAAPLAIQLSESELTNGSSDHFNTSGGTLSSGGHPIWHFRTGSQPVKFNDSGSAETTTLTEFASRTSWERQDRSSESIASLTARRRG